MTILDKSKNIFNIAISISIVFASLSLLIYSTKNNIANATPIEDGFQVAGVIYQVASKKEYARIIGYNSSTNEVKVIKSIDLSSQHN